MNTIFSTVLVGLITFSLWSQETYFVRTDGTSNIGTSWNNSFGSLQQAIDSAQAGDTIWVASGTYYPTHEFDADGSGGSDFQEKTFYINKNIMVYAGFIGNETSLEQRDHQNNQTVLSGDLGIKEDTSDNAYHVVYYDGTTDNGVLDKTGGLDGFSIKSGNSNGLNDPNFFGGGIYMHGAGFGNDVSVTIKNCLFVQNHAKSAGGAIYNNGFQGNSSPRIENCKFDNNGSGSGSAIYNYGFAGSASPNIINSSFLNNNATQDGTIYNDAVFGNSSPKMINCLFNLNSADVGGCLYNNAFFGNSLPIISNSTFYNNSANQAVLLFSAGNSGNSATSIKNSIIWDTDSFASDGDGTVTLAYSIFNDGNPDGNLVLPIRVIDNGGMLDIDPLFVDAGNGILKLLPFSPAINSGTFDTTGLNLPEFDLCGNPRISRDTVDIGAYEYICPSSSNPIYVDLSATGTGTGDSWVNAFTDLQLAFDQACSCYDGVPSIWVAQGTYYPQKSYDINNNGLSAFEKMFLIKTNVKLYGGFSGNETLLSERSWSEHKTVLSGDIGTTNDETDNSFHIMFIDGTTGKGPITSSCLVDGFTFEDGYAYSPAYPHYAGAAIFLNGEGSGSECSPIIRHCVFRDNSGYYGSAIFNNGSNGGISSPCIINCIFYENTTTYAGAVESNGENGTSFTKIYNCTFSENLGVAVVSRGTSGDCTTFLNNSILWDNGVEVVNLDANTVMEYCIYDDGNIDSTVVFLDDSISGSNNLDLDPLFRDPSLEDFHVYPISPVFNNGTPDTIGLKLGVNDLDGMSRESKDTVDIGPYEIFCPEQNKSIFVDITASGNNNGSEWSHAYNRIQDAVDLSCVCEGSSIGNEIWVAKGIYYPTSSFDVDTSGTIDAREKMIYLNKNVKLFGGFSGNETLKSDRDWMNYKTIISGDIGVQNDTSDNCFHLMYIDGSTDDGIIDTSCLIDGFTFKLGVASGSNSNDFGGGIFINGGKTGTEASPTFKHCQFDSNYAKNLGGALFFNGQSGETSPIIINSGFYNNVALFGGAIFFNGFQGLANPEIMNCVFAQNKAFSIGGAIYSNGSGGNCIVSITNSTLTKNSAVGAGGALFNGGTNGSCRVYATNSIFWNNDDEIFNVDASLEMNYSIFNDQLIDDVVNFPDNSFSGSNNLDANPLFLGDTVKNLRVKFDSPAINAGINDSISTLTDIANIYRIVRDTVDIGAYEIYCPQENHPMYVNINANGKQTGLNWEDAFNDPQMAFDNACYCLRDSVSPSVWIADGIYFPQKTIDVGIPLDFQQRTKMFYIKTDVKLYGGFKAFEENVAERDWSSHSTIFSGDLGIKENNSDNALHVFFLDGTTLNGPITNACVLDGIKIEKGYANLSPLIDVGGGIFCDGSGQNMACSPTISNVVFEDNYARSGGAIYGATGMSGACSPIILNSSFIRNSGHSGGALQFEGSNGNVSFEIDSCTFLENSASQNAGSLVLGSNQGKPTIKNSYFSNVSAGPASALFIAGDLEPGYPYVENCQFYGDTVNYGLVQIHYSSPIFNRCSFSEIRGYGISVIYNSTSNGDTTAPVFMNSSFIGNTCNDPFIPNGVISHLAVEGGVCLPKYVNCTFFANESRSGGVISNYCFNSVCSLQLTNCILWDKGIEIESATSPTFLDYCVYRDSTPENGILDFPPGVTGSHVIDFYPRFLDTASYNLRLGLLSSAIEAGTPDTSGLFLGIRDLDGFDRLNGTIDIGAFENPLVNCPDSMIIDSLYSPVQGNYQASQLIQLEHGAFIPEPNQVILDAPEVKLNATTTIKFAAEIELLQNGCINN